MNSGKKRAQLAAEALVNFGSRRCWLTLDAVLETVHRVYNHTGRAPQAIVMNPATVYRLRCEHLSGSMLTTPGFQETEIGGVKIIVDPDFPPERAFAIPKNGCHLSIVQMVTDADGVGSLKKLYEDPDFEWLTTK